MFRAWLGLVLLASSNLAAAGPEIGGCPVFAGDHIWNTRIEHLPLDRRSGDYIRAIGAEAPLHADFSAHSRRGAMAGIPYRVVPRGQARVPISFRWADVSTPGPYPIPANAQIEGGPDHPGDRHVLILERESCLLFEIFRAFPQPDGGWKADSGAVYDLRSYKLRPAGWGSADAAGLPILPGLVRYEEIQSGEILHAIRFTAPRTRRDFAWPARHFASPSTDATLPPMGQRFRLRKSFSLSGFSRDTQVVLRALRQYGMILADNGGAWFITGATDQRWPDQLIQELRHVKGSDFEAVDVTSLILDPDSGQARPARGLEPKNLPGSPRKR